ncbi:restriction endonuclease [Halobium salinum]|uniref:Restriction endonuclease n=1 Tax=Halobium salinum TaxID=1364940 RepID=A0ABD5PBN2_9EURY|nr:restriction endonuclease [Halobium salinum]
MHAGEFRNWANGVTPSEFEAAVREIHEAAGWDVEPASETATGIDYHLTRPRRYRVVSVRRWSGRESTAAGSAAVQRVAGAALEHGASEAAVVSSGPCSVEARTTARRITQQSALDAEAVSVDDLHDFVRQEGLEAVVADYEPSSGIETAGAFD